MLRRLLALGVLGAGHQFLQHGEALLPYVIVGLVILLPATWLPHRTVLAAGVLGSVAGVALVSGGTLLIPGLFLLGMGVARSGVIDTLDGRGRQIGTLCALSALAVFFVPMGRMTLTNYLTATLVVVALAPLLDLYDSGRWGTAMALAVGILLVQAAWSRWWLARFRYGPAEWCWRCVTWWNTVPVRKQQTVPFA